MKPRFASSPGRMLLGVAFLALFVGSAAAADYARQVDLRERPYGWELFLPANSGGGEEEWHLVRREWGGETPTEGRVLRVPVERMVLRSTTLVAPLAKVGGLDALAGVSDASLVTNPRIRERLREGALREVGRGTSLDLEQVLAVHPDVVLLSRFSESGDAVIARLERAGVPVLRTAEHLEPHPLGRAEWMLVMAALVGRMEEGKRAFGGIVSAYGEIAAQVPASGAPSVLVNVPWGGVWYVPGGGSFLAQLIADAGGDYPWAETGDDLSLSLDFEAVYARGLRAEVWLDAGAGGELRDLAARDSRFRRIRAFRERRVYAEDGAVVPGEPGNPLWERGVVEPHVLLADLVQIFHPEVFPERELVYYRRLQ